VVAEVVKESEDGEWILVRYVEASEDVHVIGTDDLCHRDEITEVVELASP
jgi:hypothetical protein